MQGMIKKLASALLSFSFQILPFCLYGHNIQFS